MAPRTRKTFFHMAIYFAGLVGSRGAAILLVPVYTRVIDPASFALWDLCMTTVLFLSPLFNLGLQSAVMRYFYHYDTEAEQRRVYNTALSFLFVTLVPTLTLIVLFAPRLAGALFQDAEQGPLLILVAVLAALLAVNQQPLAMLRAEERSMAFSLLQFVRGVGGPVAIILLLFAFQMGVSGIIWGEIIGAAMLTIAAFACTRRWIGLAFDTAMLRQLLAFGLPLLPMAIGSALLAVSDRYILRAYIDLEAMAPYSLGFKVGMALSLVVQAVQLSWMPAALQMDKETDGRSHIASGALILHFCIFALAAGLACFAPEVASLFAPPEGYGGAEQVIPWIALSYGIHGTVYVFTVGIGISNKTMWISAIFCFAGALKFALSLYIIPVYGIIGAAVTTCVAFLAEFLAAYVIAQRLYPLPLSAARVMSPLLMMAVLLPIVLWSYELFYPVALAVRAVALAGFVGASYATVLRKRDRHAFQKTLREKAKTIGKRMART